MAAEFIGSTILVTLISPPNAQIRGTVQDIQDQVLSLRDVLWLASGRRTESFQIPNSNLADLEVVANETAPAKFEHSPLVSAPSPEPSLIEPEHEIPTQSLTDPAILSIGKLPSLRKTDTFATLTEPFTNLSLEPGRPETSELETTELIDYAGNVELLTKPLQDQSVIPTEEVEEQQLTGKKKRRRKPRNSTPADRGPSGIVETTVAHKGSKRKHKANLSENQNGWATEDATDIQELGDFDFAANLSKFDKREIFRKLKQDDMVAESARLVGHNRAPPIGTAGGRNLHWTENVLDTPKAENDRIWNSEAGDTADNAQQIPNSGRSSRRESSRVRMPSSRKGSTMSHIGNIRQASFETSGSSRAPQKKAFGSPSATQRKASSTSPFVTSAFSQPSLRIQGSNKLCPSLTPLQTLEYEQFAITEQGLSEDMLTENAARGLAETVSHAMEVDKENLDQRSTLVAVVGNHKTGARTLAACRHLRNHGVKVIVSIMSFGRDEDLLEPIRRQKYAFFKAGGTIAKPSELLDSLKTSSIYPDIFVDALFAAHIVFDDLRRNEQAWCFELIILLNRMATQVISVDVPSGIDASNGQVTLVDGSPLAFYPHIIISFGAPKPYLLAMLQQAGTKNNPDMYVADIGISSLVWRRLGHKKQRGIDFGSRWVIKLRYQPGVE